MRNCIFAVVLACFLFASTARAEIRTWRARKGNFTAEAELVDVQNDSVVLKKKDNSTITVPLDSLSLADVRYVDEYLKKATDSIGKSEGKKKPGKSSAKKQPPAQDKDDAETPMEEPSLDEDSSDDGNASDSKEPSDEESSSETDDDKANADEEEKEGTPGKKKRREPPLTRTNSTTWQVRIDVGSEAKLRDLSIDLPEGSSIEDLAIPSTPSPFVAVNSSAGLYAWDLRNKQRVGPIKTSDIGSDRPAALSPDGDLVAITPMSNPVQIWSLRRKLLLKELKLTGKGRDAFVQFATFAGPNRLVVSAGYGGDLFVFNPHTGAEIVNFETGEGPVKRGNAAISPCGTYIAVAPSHAPVRVYDTRNGAVAGELLLDRDHRSDTCECLSFSSDGRELAALLSGDFIACWSMKNGKPLEGHEIDELGYLSDNESSVKLAFIPGRKGWLLGGKIMVDRPKGRIVWRSKQEGTNGPLFARMLDDDRMLVLSASPKDCRLTTQPFPWQEVEKATELVEKGGAASDIGMPPITVAKSGGRKLTLPNEPRKWKVPPDSFRGPELKQTQIKLPKFLRTSEPPRICAEAGRAVVTFYGRNKDASLNTSWRVFRQFDLTSGKQQGEIELDFECNTLDVGLDGGKLVVSSSKSEDRLDVYDFEGAKHLVGFRPYQGEKDSAARIAWAFLIDDKHLLTRNGATKMVLWSIPECKPIYTIENLYAGTPILSPSRKFMIGRTSAFYYVINLATGEVIGNLKRPTSDEEKFLTGYTFSDDGSTLAAIFKGRDHSSLVCWNMATGNIVSQHRHLDGKEPIWLDKGHILIDCGLAAPQPGQNPVQRAEILQLESSRILWRYQIAHGRFALQRAGGLLWYATTTPLLDNTRLVGCVLPDGEAKEHIDSTTDLPELLPEGTSVTLNVSVKLEALSDSVVQDALRERLANLLAKRGVKVEERTALALEVSVTSNPNRAPENQFNFGPPPPKTDDLECRFELTDISRKTLWSNKQVIPPVTAIPPGAKPGQNPKQLQWAQAERWLTGEGLPEKIYERWVMNGMGESALEPGGEKVLTIDVPKK